MRRREILASMGTVTASGSLVFGSGAFTGADVSRDVEVDVVGDPSAFLGLRYPDGDGEYPPAGDPNTAPPDTLTVDGETALLQALNQFSSPIESFEVEIVDGLDAFEAVTVEENAPAPFEPGDDALVTIVADCLPEGPADIDVEISARGAGFSVSAVRTFTIACPDATSRAPAAAFRGNSGQFVLEDELGEETVRAWYLDEGTVHRTAPTTSVVGDTLKLNQAFGPGPKFIFAIEFVSEGWFYLRDTWTPGSCDFAPGTTSATALTESEFCDEIGGCSSTTSLCSP